MQCWGFIRKYIKDLCETKGAIHNGYSEKTAYLIGSENLTKPDLLKRIEKHKEKRISEVFTVLKKG